MDAQQTAIAGLVFQVSGAVAGLLLVFVAFVYARGESFENVKRANQYRNAARGGIAPFGLALLCCWMSLDALHGDIAAYDLSLILFRTCVVMLALYAFIVLFVYL